MSDLVGQTLEHYRIVEKIGEGGMGSVFRARDERLGRDVAIKMLPEELVDDSARRERFEREARATAALDHPNILAIHELGLHDGVPFIVTELLDGDSLRARLAEGALDPRRAVEYGLQTARGLAAAHEKGIVHRDLKPENLFITREGTIRILDFGLAKLVQVERQGADGSEAATETMAGTEIGTVVGTSGYMSPEQLRGTGVDARSDIFSLGAVLYEMLTGSNPFRRLTVADSVSAVLTENPPAVSEKARQVSGSLDGIVRRCLEKRPEDRFQSGEDLAFALQEALDELTREPAGRSGRLRRTASAAAAGMLLAILAGVAGWYLAHRGEVADEPEAVAPDLPRIVVLPFDNLGLEEDEFFAAGIGDELTSRLAAVGGLETVAPPREEQRGRNLLDLGSGLDVDFVLTGTVRWNRRVEGQQQVRITPKLVRVGDGSLLWSEIYDRTLDDIFAIQSDIAGRVLAELDVTLLDPERVAVDVTPTSNMEAYQAYLRGLYYAQSGVEEEAILTVSMFERAVELDPDFAVAWAELSIGHSRLVAQRIDDSAQRVASAATAVDRALALGPDLARAHVAHAVYLALGSRDIPAALTELETARHLAPSDNRVVEWEGRLLVGVGRIEDSLGKFERAVKLDPTNYRAHSYLGLSLSVLRRHAEADAAYQRAIALEPDRLDAHLSRFWNALAWEGGTGRAKQVLDGMPVPDHRDVLELRVFASMANRQFEQALELVEEIPDRGVESAHWWWPSDLLECHALHWLGREAEARRACGNALAEARSGLELRPRDPRLWTTVGYSQALLGRPEDAVRSAERACAVASPDALEQDQFHRDLAAILTMTGNADRAVEEVGAALARPGSLTRAWLAVDWRVDPFREDDGFRELVAEGSK